MANSVPLGVSLRSVDASVQGQLPSPRADGIHAQPMSLASLAVGARGRVESLLLDEELRAWVSAVGIREGERITVLRRAIFGGPIHVRTGAGGEFALNRHLAKAILLRSEPEAASLESEHPA